MMLRSSFSEEEQKKERKRTKPVLILKINTINIKI